MDGWMLDSELSWCISLVFSRIDGQLMVVETAVRHNTAGTIRTEALRSILATNMLAKVASYDFVPQLIQF